MTKNILYVNNFSHFHTGSPRSIIGIMKYINRKVYTPFMLVNSMGPLLEMAEQEDVNSKIMNMLELSKDSIFPFMKNLIGNLLYLKRNHIDLIHVNYLGWKDSIVVAAKILRIPIILHVRNNPRNPKVLTKSLNVRFADRIVAVSNKTRSYLAVTDKITQKSMVIYNAIEVDTFSNSESIRPSLGIGDDELVVAIVGQVSERKGLKYFVEMASIVSQSIDDVRYLIVGKDAKGEEGYMIKMKEYAKTLGIEHRLIFTGLRDDISNIMNSIDVLVVSSISDPFPRVVLEAMASHKCVVGSSVDGIAEAIENNVTGLLVPPKDAKSLAKAVLRLLKDDILREQMGNAAFKRAKEQYDMPVLVLNIEELYAELIG